MSTFPQLSGESLARRRYEIPGGLEGSVNLLLVAFERSQQSDVDAWFEALNDLPADCDGLAAYEVPVLGNYPALYRRWVDNGMRAGIRDPQVRARTITVYTDRTAFLDAVGLPDETQIWAGLVDRPGQILWSATGPPTGAALATLHDALDPCLEPSPA